VRLLLGAAVALLPIAAQAQDWAAQKCVLYTQGWDWVLETQDLTGVRPVFLDAHQQFIDAACDHSVKICAETPREVELADMLTIMSMNEGMASTFVPFACP
jgi:hypothetical protein